MQERQARELVALEMDRGVIARPLKGGWGMYLTFATSRLELEKVFVLERARGGPRVFKTLEALVSCASRMGFRSVTVPCAPKAVESPPVVDPPKLSRQQARQLQRRAAKAG